jgi:hypothetical protein
MRLRLRVQRNELPAVNTLWPLSDTQQKHTIAQLLEAINQTFPLETDKWGLEDYVVTVASYECLHYHEIGAVCKDEDEVVVRPLTYAEVRARTLMGRSQISGDGRKLEDGIAFGRPLLRAPVRPEVRIPARKRKRGGEDEEGDEGDKRVRFLNNGEESDQTEAALLPNHKTVVVVSGNDDDSGDDEDDEEDDQDFELEDDASSAAESDSSEASSSSSGSDSSDSTESSDSSDSSSSSSSSSSSDESSNASAKASRRKKTASSVKPTSQTATKLNTKTLPGTTNKPQQTSSGAAQPGTIPYEGKRTTQERNARRRDSKKLTYLKENGILPPSADLMTLRAWEKTADWANDAAGLAKHMNTTETSSSTMQGTEDPSEEVDLVTQRQQLLASIASGGVEIGVNGKAVREESGDEGPEVHSNRVAAEHAALTERLYRENINNMTDDASASPAAPNRRGLDMSSAERLLYGSLGVRAPKTQEQKDALQKRLAGRQGTAAPKSKSKAQPKQPEIAEAETEEEDPDAWLQRIDLRAVECCDEGVELSTPPFPFYQRWDSQYRKKKNRNMATYANAPRKRRRGNQGNMVGEFVESYDKYNQDGYGDVLDYDGDGAGDEDWDQDDLAEQQLLNEVNAVPVDEFPALPENVSSLPALTGDDARGGDYVIYTELVCSPATSWQPLMLTRTVQLMEKDGDDWKVKLAVRDLPPKEYDADGNRVYGKFEMEDMSDDEEENSAEDERVKVMAFAELSDARLLERAEVQVATAAGDEAGDQ